VIPMDELAVESRARVELETTTRIVYRRRVTHVQELELRRATGISCVFRPRIGGGS